MESCCAAMKEVKITCGIALGSIWDMSRTTLSGATIFVMTVRRRPHDADDATDAAISSGKHLIVL